MTQSRTMSLLESVVNVVFGYMVAICAQVVIFPLYGIHTDTETHLKIGALFTVVSLVRGYLIRRFFNGWRR